jgi:hypothetical protein
LLEVVFLKPGLELAMTGSADDTPGQNPTPRKSRRVHLSAEVLLRRAGRPNYRAKIFDVSPDGCKAEFVERPELDEHVWVKFEGLEALESKVCWIRGFEVGLEFAKPIHPAVFDLLVSRFTT